jgi:hypothetical protein
MLFESDTNQYKSQNKTVFTITFRNVFPNLNGFVNFQKQTFIFLGFKFYLKIKSF